MKEIKAKDIKVGDYIYIESELVKVRRYILKINSIKKKVIKFKWCKLKDKTKRHLFEPHPTYFSGDDYVNLDIGMPKEYKIYKLNKKEVSEFTKILILNNL